MQSKKDVTNINPTKIKEVVRDRYGQCAEIGGGKRSCCCTSAVACSPGFATEHGLYAQEEFSQVPAIARNLSRGCGNPTGFAHLQPDEVVVDFGCGAGIDVILAARKVGPSGKVVGVDFTAEMIERAKQAVAAAGLTDRVALAVADMERLELANELADVVISNCVINLCPDKDAVYREAFRILKPGGRLAISDIVMTEKIDPQAQERFRSIWSGCVGGAIDAESYFEIVKNVGFIQLEVVARHSLPPEELEEMACCPGPAFTPAPAKEDLEAVEGKVVSIKFAAVKPRPY